MLLSRVCRERSIRAQFALPNLRSQALFLSKKAEPNSFIFGLQAIERKSIWLSSFMVHNANSLREKRDGLKVGGHQASSASCVSILTALYCGHMGPNDRIAVKPHASPIMHSIQYLLGNQTVDQLQRFRSFGGCQSYPSRTKDKVKIFPSVGFWLINLSYVL